MRDLISVVVPVYNVSSYIRGCLLSLVNQTFENLEIIVVDDGSTDDSGIICDELAILYPSKIKVIHTENGGLSRARNVGIMAASGDNIGFVDGDDWVEPEMFERLFALKSKYKTDLSVCGVKYDYDNGDNTLVKDCPDQTANQKQIYNLLINDKNIYGYTNNKLFDTSLVRAIMFDEQLYSSEDIDFCSKYAMSCKSMAYNHDELYHYRQRFGSMTGEFGYSWRKLSVIKTYEKLIDIYDKYCPECKFQIERFLLKQNLNVIGRIKVSKYHDDDILKKLYQNVNSLWNTVIKNPKNGFTERLNIMMTRLMPATMLRAKQYLIKKKYR